MKKNKQRFSAYMTVEVSLLFPLILILLVCIMYLIFLKYDQVTAFQNGIIAVLYGKSYSDKEEEDIVTAVYESLNRLNEEQYLALDSLKLKTDMENNKIQAVQSGVMNIPGLPAQMSGKMEFNEKAVVNRNNYVFYIRQIRKVKQTDD